MTPTEKLGSLLFAATCVREVIDATDDQRELNQLPRIHLAIRDFMNHLRNHGGQS